MTIGIGGYSIGGNPITLTPPAGTDGIDATLSNASNSSDTGGNLSVPITLGSDQDWSVTGGRLTVGSGQNGAISGNHSLSVSMGGSAGLNLTTTDIEIGAFSATGADSADHGALTSGPSGVSEGARANGIISLFAVSGSGTPSLNATDGNPVNLTDVAVQANGNLDLGPLTATGAGLEVGAGRSPQGTLSVSGGVSLDQNTGTSMFIDPTGTTAGTDYSQITATGPVAVGGTLNLSLAGPSSMGASDCPPSTVGTAYTLITTTGQLTGTFSNAPSGGLLQLSGPCNRSYQSSTVKITYTANSVVATVIGTSTTTLSANPSTVVTNQPTTLTATVTGGGGTPSGTVSFGTDPGNARNVSTPISGCSDQPVSRNTSGSYTATCTSAFEAGLGTSSGNTQGLPVEATFTPDANATVTSSSGAAGLFVNPDPLDFTLVVSNSSPAVGQSDTATATVTPTLTGPYKPTGNVGFKDVEENAYISSCGGSTGVAVNAAGQATCTFSLTQQQVNEGESIFAAYLGDGSTDPPFGTYTDHDYGEVSVASGLCSTCGGPSSGSGPSSGGGKSAGSGKVTFGKPKTSGATLQLLATCAAGGASCVDQYQVSVTEKLLKGKVVAVTASKAKPAKTTKVVVLGTAKVTLAAGKSKTVKLTLNAAGKKLLAKHPTLKTKLAVTTKNATKTQTLKTTTVTFKATKKKRKG